MCGAGHKNLVWAVKMHSVKRQVDEWKDICDICRVSLSENYPEAQIRSYN